MLKRELVPLLILSSWCFMIVVWLFLAVPWGCLQFVIVVLLAIFYAIITIKHSFLIHLHLQVPSGSFKPSPFRLGFQHHPRGPADVNA